MCVRVRGVLMFRPFEEIFHRRAECRDGLRLINTDFTLRQLHTVCGFNLARGALVTRLSRPANTSPLKDKLKPINAASLVNRHKLFSGCPFARARDSFRRIRSFCNGLLPDSEVKRLRERLQRSRSLSGFRLFPCTALSACMPRDVCKVDSA